MKFPDLCKKCGGKCCKHHPHMREHEYRRIREILGDERADAARPVNLRQGWWKFEEPCPCLGPDGCIIADPTDRPMVCHLYPFSPIPATKGWVLLLDVAECPYWFVWGTQYAEAVVVFERCLSA